MQHWIEVLLSNKLLYKCIFLTNIWYDCSVNFGVQQLHRVVDSIVLIRSRVDNKKVDFNPDHLERLGFLHGFQGASNSLFSVFFDKAKS